MKRDKTNVEMAEQWKWDVCDSGSPDTQAHHVIPQQTLRRRARDLGVDANLLLWDRRNGVELTRRRHERHHSGHEPLTGADVPASVFEFAEQFGLGWWLEKHLPEAEAAA